MTNDNVCPKCSKSKTASGGGFVTQFIDVCRCDELPGEQYLTVQMCSRCGMRIPRASGTMTQWIFGQGICRCDKPEIVNTRIDSVPDPDTADSTIEYEAVDLNLDPEKFPTERYLAVKELGKGAAGSVYLAIDKILNKAVAVKTLNNLSAEQLISFQDEARSTARLDHPNIVKIMDFGVSNSGIPYMVMEYIAGVSLERYIQEKGTLTDELFKSIFVNLSLCLDYAHRNDIFHRDIKPSNIILYETENGVDMKLIDFGIAKVKKESGMVTIYNDNTLAGTPSYMAPDVVNGEEYDVCSEIYSVGCVMFESLVGKPPFQGETALETFALHINNPTPRLKDLEPSINDDVDKLVACCLSKEKEKRFKNMEELHQALNEIQVAEIDGEVASVTADVDHKKNKRGVVIPVLIVGLFLVGCMAFFFSSPHLEKETIKPDLKPEKNSPKVGNDISSLSHQEQVRFKNANLSGDAMKSLEGKSVGELNFNECVLDKKSFQHIKQIRDLHHLSFYDCQTSMSNFDLFDRDSSITKLEFRKMNFDDISALSNLNLLSLTMFNCKREADDKLLDFSRMKELEFLSVELVPLGESEIQSLANLSKLNYFNLDINKRPSHIIPVSGKLKSLSSISLRNAIVDNKFINGIIQCPDLKSLSFIFCRIEEPGVIKGLARCKKLNSLSFATCSFSEKTKKEFAEFKEIDKFKLAGVYPKILKNISRVKVGTIILSNNSYISDSHLQELLKTGSIKKVRLSYCPNVSESYLKTLDEKGMLEKDKYSIPVSDGSELFQLFQKSDN